MSAIRLAFTPTEAPAGLCPVCGQGLDDEGECDICSVALREHKTVEEVRLEVEDLARSFTARFATAEGKPCTCGAGSGGTYVVEKRPRGRPRKDARKPVVGFIDYDVEHEAGCPRAPAAFDWPDVDEDARERVFGHRGRPHHVALLAGLLRHELREREILE